MTIHWWNTKMPTYIRKKEIMGKDKMIDKIEYL